MKKMVILVALSVFLWAVPSFAALTQESSGGSLTCGATDTIEIQLSPKVFAAYSGLDNTGTADFYIIASYHTAGKRVYASASSITKIYKATADADTDLATLYGQVPTSVVDAESETQWSGDLWSAE